MTIASYCILTTVTAPASYLLTDLTTWKDDWKITVSTDDDFINRTIDRCSRAAANACNRKFGIGTYQAVFRTEVGYRLGNIVRGQRAALILPVWPIVAIITVSEITADGATALSEGVDFEADYSTGEIYRLDAMGSPRDWPDTEIQIQWSAGYVLPGQPAVSGAEPLPSDIVDAVGRMAWNRYIERQRDPMVAEKVIFGVSSTKYIQGTPGSGNLSPDIADILENYRVPVTA